MQLVTVGTKYQIVIPKSVRKKIKGITPGSKVGVYTEGDKISVEPRPKSWVERTSGMMTEAWKDIDPIKEIQKMRDEWDERLEKLEKIAQTK